MNIFITLPNFYENYTLNHTLREYNHINRESFLADIIILGMSGQFPYCCWNGGITRNFGPGAFYPHFVQFSQQNASPIRFNCANNFLEASDYNDAMAHTILKIFENGSNLIEISNLELMEILAEKYPTYRFVISTELDNVMPFTPELVDRLTANEKIHLVSLPPRVNDDIDFLKEIKRRNKVEITVNPLCSVTCPSRVECANNSHKLQLIYSNKTVYDECNRSYKHFYRKDVKTLDDIKSMYLPLNINHFTFSPYVNDDNNNLAYFYMQYMIKPEKHNEFLKALREKIFL